MSRRSLFPLSVPLSLLLAVGAIGAVYLGWHESKTHIVIDVPVRELPAYYQIKSSDLTEKNYLSRNLPSKTLKNAKEIIGRYTLTNIPEKKPITEKHINSKIDSACLTDTTVVGILATLAMTLNGSLQAGDIIDITLVPAKNKTVSSSSAIVFPNILVLDVKLTPQGNTSSTSVIVIALPLKNQKEFAFHLSSATLLVSRKL
jgi:Flp pilus assembly protein CpaB